MRVLEWKAIGVLGLEQKLYFAACLSIKIIRGIKSSIY